MRSDMVFEEDIWKPSLAAHLNTLKSSFKFCCKSQVLTGINEG